MKLTRYNREQGGLIAIIVIIIIIIGGTVLIGKKILNKVNGSLKDVYEHRFDDPANTNDAPSYLPSGTLALQPDGRVVNDVREGLWILYWSDSITGPWCRIGEVYCSPECKDALLWDMTRWDVEQTKLQRDGCKQKIGFYAAWPD